MKPEGNADFGCIGSWLILLVIGIFCAIIGVVSDGWNNFIEYEQKENGAFGGTLIIAFVPIALIAAFVFLYNKKNSK